MGFIGFTEREQDEIFRIIAMVLMYGQIDFTQANDTGAAVTTGSSGEGTNSERETDRQENESMCVCERDSACVYVYVREVGERTK